MELAHFIMIENKLMNNYPYVVLEHSPIIILDSKSDVCMAKNGKGTKQTRHISRKKNLVRKVEECNMHKKLWYEGGMKLVDIGTKNVRDDKLNPGLGYIHN